MAKLKAPLMSLGAAGQLGKTLVFFPWKGINAVREYVIPANPDTQAQKDQRDFIRKGVAKVHTAQAHEDYPIIVQDQVAYSALAAAKGRIITWFNQAIKLWIDVKVKNKIPIIYSFGGMVDKSALDACPLIAINEETANKLKAGKFYLGSSKTNLIKSKDASVVEGSRVYLEPGEGFDDLTVGDKYFWQFRPDPEGDCALADSGIYYFVAS
ncbi:unnamed protein product [marine sediment metagenome]|uniref:Uncharacterized protein n=1 Tax=marine sediment metagenome TaxID=412755 RepID=X1L4F4_9ZZZZ